MKYHKDNKYISKITLRVTDINKSVDFYNKVLGFEVLEKDNNSVVLGFTNNPLVILKQAKTAKHLRTAGLYHIAFLVPRRSNLANWLYYHIQNETPLEGASNHLVSEAIYLHDIDGNGIEVYADTPDSTWKWNKESIKMATIRLDIDDLFTEVSKPTNSLPKDTIIGHIHLSVLDLKESKEFYKILGFEEVLDMSSASFMSDNKYHHHIGMNVWNSYGARLHDEEQADIDSFLIRYPNRGELDSVMQKLKNKGIAYKKNNNIVVVNDVNNIEVHLES